MKIFFGSLSKVFTVHSSSINKLCDLVNVSSSMHVEKYCKHSYASNGSEDFVAGYSFQSMSLKAGTSFL